MFSYCIPLMLPNMFSHCKQSGIQQVYGKTGKKTGTSLPSIKFLFQKMKRAQKIDSSPSCLTNLLFQLLPSGRHYTINHCPPGQTGMWTLEFLSSCCVVYCGVWSDCIAGDSCQCSGVDGMCCSLCTRVRSYQFSCSIKVNWAELKWQQSVLSTHILYNTIESQY